MDAGNRAVAAAAEGLAVEGDAFVIAGFESAADPLGEKGFASVGVEALVPMAIAEAFKSGRLGVMEYYSMKNLQSDTTMRSNIANMTGNQDK